MHFINFGGLMNLDELLRLPKFNQVNLSSIYRCNNNTYIAWWWGYINIFGIPRQIDQFWPPTPFDFAETFLSFSTPLKSFLRIFSNIFTQLKKLCIFQKKKWFIFSNLNLFYYKNKGRLRINMKKKIELKNKKIK